MFAAQIRRAEFVEHAGANGGTFSDGVELIP